VVRIGAEPALDEEAVGGVVGVGVRDQARRTGRAGARFERAEQEAADAATAELGVHGDAHFARVEAAAPGRADGLVAPVEREHREVARPSPSLDEACMLRICDERVEGRSFFGTVVAPVRDLVAHLREERGIGARAQPEHTYSVGCLPMRVRAAAALVLALTVAGACSGDDDSREPSPPPVGTDANASTLVWEACRDVECATLAVPVDHDEPGGQTLDLALTRRRAGGDRIGALVMNPGGPGVAGTDFVEDADLFFSDRVLERFDIVGWDPRGTGRSAPVDCVDDLDFFYEVDTSPDTPAEQAAALDAAERLVEGCAQRSAELLPYVSTRATVQDLDLIRAALGEERLTYFGFSYGTYIGALYADAFPDRVRAMVLDGAVDPSLSFEEVARDQARGFDAALEAFLEHCARTDCGFGGDDPRESYGLLMEAIDAEELYAEIAGEERALGPGEADIGVASALYAGEDGWGILADALREAAQGDGSTLLSLADAYTGRDPGGEYDNQTEAFYAIGCLDTPTPRGDEFTRVADAVAADAPSFGAATVYLSSPCAVWPVDAVAEPAPVRAAGTPPILVLGTTNDPATPLKWAEGLASQLESGVLVVFEGEGHTAYGRGNDCIDDAVDAYLVDMQAPKRGMRC